MLVILSLCNDLAIKKEMLLLFSQHHATRSACKIDFELILMFLTIKICNKKETDRHNKYNSFSFVFLNCCCLFLHSKLLAIK